MRGFFTAKKIAKLGIFAALATVLYFLNFSLPIFPSFLSLNLSDLPALICGFALGPVSAFITILIKVLIKLPFSTTMAVGEFADLIIGSAFVIPASLIYRHNKTKKNAVIGMAVGTLASVVVGMLANWLVLIPFYVLIGLPFHEIVGMCAKVIPFINEANFYVVYIFVAVLPFNLLRCLIAGIVTFFVYKRISILLKKWDEK